MFWTDYVLSEISQWEPEKDRTHLNPWSVSLLAAGVDSETQNTLAYGVGAGALVLAFAGACVVMKRRKDEKRAVSDDFERM